MHIAGLNPEDLPKDDSGVDVKKILQCFQHAIKDTPGWEVKYEAWLGCFSFQKILMYNDLKNRTDELIKNPIVDHILNHPTEEFDDKIEMVRESEIDESIKSRDIYCPLSADSSQISAVLSAERGKSFILFGPPGTGKSQTITNIIAHCLATKKKILFVSEKKAALEVVYRRLQDVGLDPFCLELHSNKAGKTEVMTKLYIAPLTHISETDGAVCLPEGLRIDRRNSLEENMNLVSELFYQGKFGHATHSMQQIEHPGGHDGFWIKYLKKKKHDRFPVELLKSANQTLGDLLK